MKNKKIWIIAVCVLLVVLVLVLAMSLGRSPAAPAQGKQESLAEDSVDEETAKTDKDGRDGTVTVEDEGGENVSVDDEQGSAAQESADPNQPLEEVTEDGVVIIIPEGMSIGEGDD